MGTKARILAVVHLDGKIYQPNQVVDLPAANAKSLADQGQVDPDKGAISYCINELGAEVIVHAAPKAASKAPPPADTELAGPSEPTSGTESDQTATE
jgi:hypothetical protein